MRVQMAAAPAPSYGIDNVVYGGGPAGYMNPAAPSPYQPAPAYAAAPTYAPQAMPAYGMATTPTYAAVTGQAYTAPAYATPAYTTAAASPYGGYPGAAVTAYAAPAAYAPPQQAAYTLDSGDRLRVVVFGQDGLTNSYVVDVSGDIAMPLIGSVAARGLTTDQLSSRIAGLLRQGYV
ncbi:MAG: polysaccharide biosynthesis/export family protein, partial [Xanthobacteraceae bacterium]